MRRILPALPAVAVLALGVLALAACRGPGFKTDGKVGAAVFVEAGPRYGVGAEVKIPSIEIGGGAVAHPITGEAPQAAPAPVERPFVPAPPLPPTSEARPKVCFPGDPDCDLPAPEPVAGDWVHRVETPIILLDARPDASPDAILVSDPAPPPNALADEWTGRPWVVAGVSDLASGNRPPVWTEIALAASDPVVESTTTNTNDPGSRATGWLIGFVILAVVALLWWAARCPDNDPDAIE